MGILHVSFLLNPWSYFILLPKRKKTSTTTAVQFAVMSRMAQRRGGDWLVLFTWHVFFFGSLILNAPGEFISSNFIHLKFWMVQYRFEYKKKIHHTSQAKQLVGAKMKMWCKIACRFHVKLEPHNFHSKFALLWKSKWLKMSLESHDVSESCWTMIFVENFL